MGQRQVRRRDFRQLSTVSFTSCVMGTWEIALATNGPGVHNGGISGFFW